MPGLVQFNLVFRFLLEIANLTLIAWYGSSLAEGWMAWFLAVLLAVLTMVLWGVFAVSGDPSRSGKTVIETPGLIRLLLELFIFGAGAWVLFHFGHVTLGWIYFSLLLLHHILYKDRMLWLIRK
jgi:hypothetical protein